MAAALRKFMESVGLREPEMDEYEAEYRQDLADEAVAEIHQFPGSTEIGEDLTAIPLHSEQTSGIQRIRTAKPQSYAECKEIGNSLRNGVPVILNLNYMKPAEMHRMVDFTLGVCYGIGGHFEQVGPKVMLLTPEGIEPEQQQGEKVSSLQQEPESWRML